MRYVPTTSVALALVLMVAFTTRGVVAQATCPDQWVVVSRRASDGAIKCASLRLEPFAPVTAEYFCGNQVSLTYASTAAQARSVPSSQHALAGTPFEIYQTTSALQLATRISLSGAFIGGNTIQWFDGTTSPVSSYNVDPATLAMLASDTTALTLAAGSPAGCVAYNPGNQTYFSVPCYQAQLPFVCTLYVSPPVPPTPPPTPAPPVTTASPNSTFAPPPVTPVPATPFPLKDCVSGFTFSTQSGYCVKILAAVNYACGDAAAACKAAYYYARPMTITSVGTAADVAAMMAEIKDPLPSGLIVRRTASLAWTGGVYSQSMGAGAWNNGDTWDPTKTLWDTNEPAVSYGCIALAADTAKWRLIDQFQQEPAICAYIPDGRTVPVPTTPSPPTTTQPVTTAVPPGQTTAVPMTPSPPYRPSCLPDWILAPTIPVSYPILDGALPVAKCLKFYPNTRATAFLAEGICGELLSREQKALMASADYATLVKYRASLQVKLVHAYGASLDSVDDARAVYGLVQTEQLKSFGVANATTIVGLLGGAYTNQGPSGFWFDTRTDWVDSLVNWASVPPAGKTYGCMTVDGAGFWRAVDCNAIVRGVVCEYYVQPAPGDIPTPAPMTVPPAPVALRLQTLEGRQHLVVPLNSLGAYRVGTYGGSLAGQALFFSTVPTCPTGDLAAQIIATRFSEVFAITSDGWVYPEHKRVTPSGIVCILLPSVSPPGSTPIFSPSNVTFEVVDNFVASAQIAQLQPDPTTPTAPILATGAALTPLAPPAQKVVVTEGITAQLRLFGIAPQLRAIRLSDTRRCNSPNYVFGPKSIPVTQVSASDFGGATTVASIAVAETTMVTQVDSSFLNDLDARTTLSALPSNFFLCVTLANSSDLYVAMPVNFSVPVRSVVVDGASLSWPCTLNQQRVVGGCDPLSRLTDAEIARIRALLANYTTPAPASGGYDVPLLIVGEHSSPEIILRGRNLAEGMAVRLSSDPTCVSSISQRNLITESGASFPSTMDWDMALAIDDEMSLRNISTMFNFSFPAGDDLFMVQLSAEHTRVRTTDGTPQNLGTDSDIAVFKARLAQLLRGNADAIEIVARFTLCVAFSPTARFFSTGFSVSIARQTVRGLGGQLGFAHLGQGFSGPLSVQGIAVRHRMAPLGAAPATIDKMRLLFSADCTRPTDIDTTYRPGKVTPLSLIPDEETGLVTTIVPPNYFSVATGAPLRVCLSVDAGATWTTTDARLDVVPTLITGFGDQLLQPSSTLTPNSFTIVADADISIPITGSGFGPLMVAMFSAKGCLFKSTFNPTRDVAFNASLTRVGTGVDADTAYDSLGSGTQYVITIARNDSRAAFASQKVPGTYFALCLLDVYTGIVSSTVFSVQLVNRSVTNIDFNARLFVDNVTVGNFAAPTLLAPGMLTYGRTGVAYVTGYDLDGTYVVAAQDCTNPATFQWAPVQLVRPLNTVINELTLSSLWHLHYSEVQTTTLAASKTATVPTTAKTNLTWCISVKQADLLAASAPLQFVSIGLEYRVLPMAFTGLITNSGSADVGGTMVAAKRGLVLRGDGAAVRLVGDGANQMRDGFVFLRPWWNPRACNDPLAPPVYSASLLAVHRGVLIIPSTTSSSTPAGRYRMCVTSAMMGAVANGTNATVNVLYFAQAGDLSVDIAAPTPTILGVYSTTSDPTDSTVQPQSTITLQQRDQTLLRVQGFGLRIGQRVRISPYYPPTCAPALRDAGLYTANFSSASPRDMVLLGDIVTTTNSDAATWLLHISAEQTAILPGSYTLCVEAMSTAPMQTPQWTLTHALRVEVTRRRVAALSLHVTDTTASLPFLVDPTTGTLVLVRRRPPMYIRLEMDGVLPLYSTVMLMPATNSLQQDGTCSGGTVAVVRRLGDGTTPYFQMPPEAMEWDQQFRVCVDLAVPRVYTPVAAEALYPPQAGSNLLPSNTRFGRIAVMSPRIDSVNGATNVTVAYRQAVSLRLVGWGIEAGMYFALIPDASLGCSDIGVPNGRPTDQPLIDATTLVMSRIMASDYYSPDIDTTTGYVTLLSAQTEYSAFSKLMNIQPDTTTAVLPDGTLANRLCFSYNGRTFSTAGGAPYEGKTPIRIYVPPPPVPAPLPIVIAVDARQPGGTWPSFTVPSYPVTTQSINLAVPTSLFGLDSLTNAGQPLVWLRVTGSRFSAAQTFVIVRRPVGTRDTDTSCSYARENAATTLSLNTVAVSPEGTEILLNADPSTADQIAAGKAYELCVGERNIGDDPSTPLLFRAPLAVTAVPTSAAVFPISGVISITFAQSITVGPTALPVVLLSVNKAIDAAIPARDSGALQVTLRLSTAYANTITGPNATNNVWIRVVPPFVDCSAPVVHERRYLVQNPARTQDLSAQITQGTVLMTGTISMPSDDTKTALSNTAMCFLLVGNWSSGDPDDTSNGYTASSVVFSTVIIRTLNEQAALSGDAVVEGANVALHVLGIAVARGMIIAAVPDVADPQNLCVGAGTSYLGATLDSKLVANVMLATAQSSTQPSIPTSIRYHICLSIDGVRWTVQPAVLIARPIQLQLMHIAGQDNQPPSSVLTSLATDTADTRVITLPPFYSGWVTTVGEGLTSAMQLVINCNGASGTPQIVYSLDRDWAVHETSPNIGTTDHPLPLHVLRVMVQSSDLQSLVQGQRYSVCLLTDSNPWTPMILQPNLFFVVAAPTSPIPPSPIMFDALNVTSIDPSLLSRALWWESATTDVQYCYVTLCRVIDASQGQQCRDGISLQFRGSTSTTGYNGAILPTVQPTTTINVSINGTSQQVAAVLCGQRQGFGAVFVTTPTRVDVNVWTGQYPLSWQGPDPAALGAQSFTLVAPYVTNLRSQVPTNYGDLTASIPVLKSSPTSFIAVEQGQSVIVRMDMQSPFVRPLLRFGWGCDSMPASAPFSEVVRSRAVVPADFTTAAGLVATTWPPRQPGASAAALAQATYPICSSVDNGITFTEISSARIVVTAAGSTAAEHEGELDIANRNEIAVIQGGRGQVSLARFVARAILAKGSISTVTPSYYLSDLNSDVAEYYLPDQSPWFPDDSLIMISKSCLYSTHGIPLMLVSGNVIDLLPDLHTRTAGRFKICVRRTIITAYVSRPVTKGFVDSGVTLNVLDTSVSQVNIIGLTNATAPTIFQPFVASATSTMPFVTDRGAAAWPLRFSKLSSRPVIVRLGRPCSVPLQGPLALAKNLRVLSASTADYLFTLTGDLTLDATIAATGLTYGDELSLCVSVDGGSLFVSTGNPMSALRRSRSRPSYDATTPLFTTTAQRGVSYTISATALHPGSTTTPRDQLFFSTIIWRGFVSLGDTTTEGESYWRLNRLLFAARGQLYNLQASATPNVTLLDRAPVSAALIKFTTALSVTIAQPMIHWAAGRDASVEISILSVQAGLRVGSFDNNMPFESRLRAGQTVRFIKTTLMDAPNVDCKSEYSNSYPTATASALRVDVPVAEHGSFLTLPLVLARASKDLVDQYGDGFVMAACLLEPNPSAAIPLAARMNVFSTPTAHTVDGISTGDVHVDQQVDTVLRVLAAGLNPSVVSSTRPRSTLLFIRMIPANTSCSTAATQALVPATDRLAGLLNYLFPVVTSYVRLLSTTATRRSTWGWGPFGAVTMCFTTDGVTFNGTAATQRTGVPLLLSVDPPHVYGFRLIDTPQRILRLLRLPAAPAPPPTDSKGQPAPPAAPAYDALVTQQLTNASFAYPMVFIPGSTNNNTMPRQYARYVSGVTTAVMSVSTRLDAATLSLPPNTTARIAVVPLPTNTDGSAVDPARWCVNANTTAVKVLYVNRASGLVTSTPDGSPAPANDPLPTSAFNIACVSVDGVDYYAGTESHVGQPTKPVFMDSTSGGITEPCAAVVVLRAASADDASTSVQSLLSQTFQWSATDAPRLIAATMNIDIDPYYSTFGVWVASVRPLTVANGKPTGALQLLTQLQATLRAGPVTNVLATTAITEAGALVDTNDVYSRQQINAGVFRTLVTRQPASVGVAVVNKNVTQPSAWNSDDNAQGDVVLHKGYVKPVTQNTLFGMLMLVSLFPAFIFGIVYHCVTTTCSTRRLQEAMDDAMEEYDEAQGGIGGGIELREMKHNGGDTTSNAAE